jgi:phenylacetate-CoA ligase
MLSNLIRRMLYPCYLRYSGQNRVLTYLREFENTQYRDPTELKALQTARLRSLLRHAYEQCPFYRARFDRMRLRPSAETSWAHFQALPVLGRSDLQRFQSQMTASNWPRGDLTPNQTGGSTGEPVSFFVSHDRACSRLAATIRHNRWAGLDVGDKVAYLWGAATDQPPSRWRTRLRNRLIDRQLFLDASNVTEERLRQYLDALKVFRPRVMVAYARAAVLFARFLRDRMISAYQPEAIITSAEVLTDPERQLIEATFGCRVFNRYGSREVSVIASECEQHRGLHTMAESLVVEIVAPDGSPIVEPGRDGAIVVTDLLNYAMPLIRYRIGDAGSWEAGTCACGRGLPRLRHVAGRVTDFLLGTDGRWVSGAFLTIAIAARRTSLGQIQILQNAPATVRYRIKPGPGFSRGVDLAFLSEATRRYLGQGMAIDFELVERIDPEPSGKQVFCKSNLEPLAA